jgi:hypothetical protein
MPVLRKFVSSLLPYAGNTYTLFLKHAFYAQAYFCSYSYKWLPVFEQNTQYASSSQWSLATGSTFPLRFSSLSTSLFSPVNCGLCGPSRQSTASRRHFFSPRPQFWCVWHRLRFKF